MLILISDRIPEIKKGWISGPPYHIVIRFVVYIKEEGSKLPFSGQSTLKQLKGNILRLINRGKEEYRENIHNNKVLWN